MPCMRVCVRPACVHARKHARTHACTQARAHALVYARPTRTHLVVLANEEVRTEQFLRWGKGRRCERNVWGLANTRWEDVA